MPVAPADDPEAPLSLQMFGPFHAFVHGQSLPKMRTRKEQWLLALLALRAGETLDRVWLATTLWPDGTEAGALGNLRRSLGILRDALGPEARRILSPTPRTLQLDLTGAACDVTDFDAAARRGDENSLEAAIALYRGPLLQGCLEEWVVPEREARERAVLGALETLAARGGADGAAHWQRALELDPLRETALRGLMTALAAQGSHTAAVEAYHAFRRHLRDELNSEPDPETVLLYRRLQTEGRRPSQQKASPDAVPPPAPVLTEAAHLPAPLTTLIGRERETEVVACHLDDARLVTLTGTGGIGKTRIALALAGRLHEEFPDGAWFADLSALADPKLMVQAVLSALGAREAPGRSPSEALAEHLRPKRLLLVLDNCEHLVSACAHLVRALLEQCPALHILATSREALGVVGEVLWRVPSLSLPDNAVGADDSEAVRLFVDRARQGRPGWTPSEPEYAVVADICQRLDGIPLAIEMAAARTRSLPTAQIAARLDDTFRLLSNPGGGQVPRQQTLRATLDWSWDLLSGDEKTLLARLSVFAGGWTLEAAEAICAGDRPEDFQVLDVLTGLIDKSLVIYEERAGTGRYRLLETVRQYARERLAEGGEADAVGGRAGSWFLALAEQAEPQLTGPEQTTWLARLETEHDNLRAALEQSLGDSGAADVGLRFVGVLERFWQVRGHLTEARRWLDRALTKTPDSVSASARAKALNALGNTAYLQGDFGAAQSAHEECLALRRGLGRRAGIATSLNNLGNVAWAQGDYGRAQALYQENLAIRKELGDRSGVASTFGNLANVAYNLGDYAVARSLNMGSLAIRRELGDRQGIATTLQNLGNVMHAQGDYGAAKSLAEESLAIRRELGDRQGIADALNNLGRVAMVRSEYEMAKALHAESLAIKRDLGDRKGVAYSLHNLGDLCLRQGDHRAARPLHAESLGLLRQIGDKYGLVHSLEGLADVEAGLQRPLRAARLLGAAGALHSAMGSPVEPADQADRDQSVASIQAVLGEAAFAAAWAEGQAMTWEQAAEYALSEG